MCFLNPAVPERLEQGKSEPAISGLWHVKRPTSCSAYFIKAVQETPGLVEIINKYLKRIVVKRVRMADFRPKTGTIQKIRLGKWRRNSPFPGITVCRQRGDDDSLPMLRLE